LTASENDSAWIRKYCIKNSDCKQQHPAISSIDGHPLLLLKILAI
jgi:hypothetical protein